MSRDTLDDCAGFVVDGDPDDLGPHFCAHCGEIDPEALVEGLLVCFSCREDGEREANGMVISVFGLLALLIMVPFWAFGLLPGWTAFFPIGLLFIGGTTISGSNQRKDERAWYNYRPARNSDPEHR